LLLERLYLGILPYFTGFGSNTGARMRINLPDIILNHKF